jgi:uncharacterized protein YqeY
MGLKSRLMEDLKTAMRQRDGTRKSTIRLTLSAIKNAEIEKGRDKELEEGEVLALVAREAKRRRDSIKEFEKGGRPDLVASEEAELRILQEYLPQQMSRQEIEVEAQRVIDELGASGPRQVGDVMRRLMPQLKGRADGRMVNEVVTSLLKGSGVG